MRPSRGSWATRQEGRVRAPTEGFCLAASWVVLHQKAPFRPFVTWPGRKGPLGWAVSHTPDLEVALPPRAGRPGARAT